MSASSLGATSSTFALTLEQRALKDEVFYYEVTKAHHEYRWLKQKRLLIITSTEIMKADNTTLRPQDPLVLKPSKRFEIAALDLIAMKSKTSFLLRFSGGDHDYFYKSDAAALDIITVLRTRFSKLRAAAVVGATTAPASPSLSASPKSSPRIPTESTFVDSQQQQQQQQQLLSPPYHCSPPLAAVPSPTNSLNGSSGASRRVIVANDDEGSPQLSRTNRSRPRLREDILTLFSNRTLDVPSSHDTDEFIAQKMDLLRAMHVDALDDMDKLRSLIARYGAGHQQSQQRQQLINDHHQRQHQQAHAHSSPSHNQQPQSNSDRSVTTPNSSAPPSPHLRPNPQTPSSGRKSMRSDSFVIGIGPLPPANPELSLAFRAELNHIKESFLHQLATRERSLTSKISGKWNGRKLPKFDDETDAILIVEEALQAFTLTPAVSRSLWCDVKTAFDLEQRRFDSHCARLNDRRVPFSFFGIRPNFQPIKFDLVLVCLKDLESCQTPVAILTKIVEAIKSVVLCIKTFLITERRLTASRHSSPLHSPRGGTGGSQVGQSSNSRLSSPLRHARGGMTFPSPPQSQPNSQHTFAASSAEANGSQRNGAPPRVQITPSSPMPLPSRGSHRTSTASVPQNRETPQFLNEFDLETGGSAPPSFKGSSRAGSPKDSANQFLRDLSDSSSNSDKAEDGAVASPSAISGGGEGGSDHADDENDPFEDAELTEAQLEALAAECAESCSTDDILPVLIYILVHCRVPHLVFYRAFVETVGDINEATERIFYFTVYCSAVQWILNWEPPRHHEEEVHRKTCSSPKASSRAGSPRHRSRTQTRTVPPPPSDELLQHLPQNQQHSQPPFPLPRQDQQFVQRSHSFSARASPSPKHSNPTSCPSPVNSNVSTSPTNSRMNLLRKQRRESQHNAGDIHSPFSTPRLTQKSPNSSEAPSAVHSYQQQ